MYKMGSCNRSKIQDEDNSLKLFVINLKKKQDESLLELSLIKTNEKPVTNEKIIKIYKQEFKQLMILIPSYDSNNQTPPNTDCQSQSTGKSQ